MIASEKSMSNSTKFQMYFNIFNHIIIGLITIYVTIICIRGGSTMYNWHAWLCAIGYQLLMTEAIMSFYSANSWSQFHSNQLKKRIHWILMGIGSTLAIGGMIVEYIYRELADKPHFRSTHALLGLVSFVFTIIGVLNGTATLWSSRLNGYVKASILKCFHNSVGIVAFVTGMIALYYGFDKNLFKKHSEITIRLLLQIGSIATIVLSLIGAICSGYNRYKKLLS